MTSRSARALVLAAALVASTAVAEEEATPELDAERDRLIEKIIRGEDLERSLQEFQALVARRDGIRAASERAKAQEKQQREEARAWREAWKNNPDSEVGWRCRLSVDPANPQPSDGWP